MFLSVNEFGVFLNLQVFCLFVPKESPFRTFLSYILEEM